MSIVYRPDTKFLYVLALLTFIPALFYFYVGEEGIYTIYSMEMWQHQHFLGVIGYGGRDTGRPPLYNWLMIPIARFIGWEYVLVAARLITVGATFSSSLIVGWLALQIWRDKEVAVWAALFYISLADVILYRGWLAYSDPLFAMLVLLALAWLWVSCIRNSRYYLAAAVIAAFAAFLAKALTVYVFLGIAWIVLARAREFRRFLLDWRCCLIYLPGIFLPVSWLALNPQNAGQGNGMLHDVMAKFSFAGTGDYLAQVIGFPLEMIVRLMPASFILIYILLRKRESIRQQSSAAWTALLIVLLNFLPYWLSPQSSVRYVLPIYPFLALATAYLVVKSDLQNSAKRLVAGMIVLGFIMKGIFFPYYQSHYRGENYFETAREILGKYDGSSLYSMDSAAAGLSVTAYLDSLRFPRPALVLPGSDFSNGIVLADSPDAISGRLIQSYRLGGDKLYLVCRGAKCAAN